MKIMARIVLKYVFTGHTLIMQAVNSERHCTFLFSTVSLWIKKIIYMTTIHLASFYAEFITCCLIIIVLSTCCAIFIQYTDNAIFNASS